MVEEVVGGLELPTNMAFLGPDDFLVLEKDKGTVVRVKGGIIADMPLLDVNVANFIERGMCGIAVSNTGLKTTYSSTLLKLTGRMVMIGKVCYL